ncbi:hypothetical protein SEUCBS140593_000283 [Sporothrix eucalyptigena]|uniref:Uncharacterized protein n=1 Tax=Sporothrix eucalyptigena TaxID=1812306 RepID=A0ABP0ANL2_9PEZI
MASTNDQNPADNMSRNRRSSVTSATLSSIFRSNSISNAPSGTPIFPGPITSAAMDQNRRRRLSISTTAALGLSGGSGGNGSVSAGPSGAMGANSFAARRASMSTNSSASDSAFDENAIEDDDVTAGASRTAPNTPFARRMSFGAQAMRNFRGPGGTSPGGASSNGRLRSTLSGSAATSSASGGGLKQPQQQQQQNSFSSASGSLPPLASSPRSPRSPPVPTQSSSSYVSPRSPITIPAQQRNAPRGGSFSLSSSAAAANHANPNNTVHSPRTASDKVFFPAARADQGYNWPEQLRSRAESSVTSGSRPSFSFASGMGNSPPRASGFGGIASYTSGGGGVGNGGGVGMRHDRAKSVSDIPAPAPAQPRPAPQPRREARPKPDHFQERILKGDFYMD